MWSEPERCGAGWAIVITTALAGAAWWWSQGRAIDIPPASPGRIDCISYDPLHRPGQSPLEESVGATPAQIDADIALLAQHVDCVRTYVQDQGLEALPAIARRHGVRILLGLWLGRDAASNDWQIRTAVATANANRDVVRAVIVGSEVLIRGDLTEDTLRTELRRVRRQVRQPVTYADAWDSWLRHPHVAEDVDMVMVHMLPYWGEPSASPAEALRKVATQYDRLKAAFPGKLIFIAETGWPDAGRPQFNIRASLADETRYVRGFLDYARRTHVPYNLFAAFDVPWKRREEGTAGGHWGIFGSTGAPKLSMSGPVVEDPQWWLGEWTGVSFALLFFLVLRLRRRPSRRAAALALLIGFETGTAVAWQWRQAYLGCVNAGEWMIAGASCAAAVATSFSELARLWGYPQDVALRYRLFLCWLAAMSYVSLLLAFNGRHRDLPLGLFAIPAVTLCAGSLLRPLRVPCKPELAFLALLLPCLAIVIVALERGLDPATWAWLAIGVMLNLPTVMHSPRGLPGPSLPRQQQPKDARHHRHAHDAEQIKPREPGEAA